MTVVSRRLSNLALLVGILFVAELNAQPAARGDGLSARVAVTVALSEAISDSVPPYTILRIPGSARPDVIVLRHDADEHSLSEAVRTLLLTRRQTGDVPASAGRFRMRRSEGGHEGRPSVLPWAARVLRDLRESPIRPVDGVGAVKAVEIWLPR